VSHAAACKVGAALAVSMAHEVLQAEISRAAKETLAYDPATSKTTPVDTVCKLGEHFAAYLLALASYGIYTDQAAVEVESKPSKN
jgi:hypothetical protein